MGHRPNDYHPDHRACAQLMLDASYLSKVPNICPLVPPLARPPVVIYMHDDFQRPYAFQPDVVIDIGAVVDQKTNILAAHASQVYEWLPHIKGKTKPVPSEDAARHKWVQEQYMSADQRHAENYRSQLAARYGDTHAAQVRFAEAFEVSEYGLPWSAALEERLKFMLTPA